MQNHMFVRFNAISQNEGFARMVAGGFASMLNPTLTELADVKTSISEAVTNAIIHGYKMDASKEVEIEGIISGNLLTLKISDTGGGIADIDQAKTPFYTSCRHEERSGMGFTVMEAFMDSLEIISVIGEGTTVIMTKKMGQEDVD